MATTKKVKLWAAGIGWQEFEADHAKKILSKERRCMWFEEDQTKKKSLSKADKEK